MKKFFKSGFVLISIVLIFAAFSALASAETVLTDKSSGVTYVIDGDHAKVYSYDHRGGNVTILSKVNGFPVTEIGNYAFAEEYDDKKTPDRITKVSIPDSVKKIGNGAFMECTALTKVEIPFGVTQLGDAVFWECINLKTVCVAGDVKAIGANAFGECPKLTLYCAKGSVVETYAKSNDIACKSLFAGKIKLNKSSASLSIGKTVSLKATLSPSDVYYPEHIWISSDNSVATVSENGVVTAKGYGTVTITCHSVLGEASATCKITVGIPKVSGFRVSAKEYNGYTLKWDSVKKASGYRLQEYKNSKWKTVKDVKGTSYKFSKIGTNKSGKYRVCAYFIRNSKRIYGSYSSTLTAMTRTPVSVKKVTFSKCTASSVTIKWSSVKNADGYRIYVYKPSEKKYRAVTNTKKTSATLTGLSAGKEYTYKIRAYINVGKETSLSHNFSKALKTVTKPAQVKNLKAVSIAKDAVNLTWSKASGADGYYVYRYKDGTYTKVASTKKTSAAIDGLKKNAGYIFTVRAYSVLDSKKYYSSYSELLKVTTNYLPSSIQDIVAEFNSAYSNTAKSSRFYASKSVTSTVDIDDYAVSSKNAYNIASAWINDFNSTSFYQCNFASGKDLSTGKTVAEFMSPTGSVKPVMTSAVKSAKLVSDGSGYAVTMVLKSETVDETKIPPYNGPVADFINWTSINKTIKQDAYVEEAKIKYSGTTVKAKINKNGKLDTLTVSTPYSGSLSGVVEDKDDITLKISGKIFSDYIFSW